MTGLWTLCHLCWTNINNYNEVILLKLLFIVYAFWASCLRNCFFLWYLYFFSISTNALLFTLRPLLFWNLSLYMGQAKGLIFSLFHMDNQFPAHLFSTGFETGGSVISIYVGVCFWPISFIHYLFKTMAYHLNYNYCIVSLDS